MMNRARLRRGRMTASMRALVRIGAAAPVALMTMSLAASAASRSSQGAASAPPIASAVRAACAIVRLTIVTWCTPCDFMCSAVSLPISPAPTTTTLRPFRVAENLPRERDGREAHRDGARAEPRFGPHALADAERRVEQAVQDRADRTGRRRPPCTPPSPGRGSAARRRRASRGRRRPGTGGAPHRDRRSS